MTELEQPKVQTHEKAGHQRKEQGQMTIKMYTREIKALMLMRQAMHKLNPTIAQVREANGIQQVQDEE